MSRRWKGRGGKVVEDSLVVEEGMLVKFPLEQTGQDLLEQYKVQLSTAY